MSNRPAGSAQGPGMSGRRPGFPSKPRGHKPPRPNTSMAQRGNSAATHSPLARALMASNTTRSILSKRVSVRNGKRGVTSGWSGDTNKLDDMGSAAGSGGGAAVGAGTDSGRGAGAEGTRESQEGGATSTSSSKLTAATLRDRVRAGGGSKSLGALDLSQLSSSSPAGMVAKPKSPKADVLGGSSMLFPSTSPRASPTSPTTPTHRTSSPDGSSGGSEEEVSDDDTPARPYKPSGRTGGTRRLHVRSKSFGSGLISVPDLYTSTLTAPAPSGRRESGHDAAPSTAPSAHVDERDRDDVPYIRGSRLAEISGFVLWITSFSCGVMFFLWAYLPENVLHQFGIMWYPRKYWAIAAPAWILVLIAYVAFMYVALNMMKGQRIDSYNMVTDSFAAHPPGDEGLAPSRHAVPPLYDIPVGLVSRLLYSQPTQSGTVPPTPILTSHGASPEMLLTS